MRCIRPFRAIMPALALVAALFVCIASPSAASPQDSQAIVAVTESPPATLSLPAPDAQVVAVDQRSYLVASDATGSAQIDEVTMAVQTCNIRDEQLFFHRDNYASPSYYGRMATSQYVARVMPTVRPVLRN